MYANPNGGTGATAGPEENPVLRFYKDWAARTPYISRCVMTCILVTFILGLFFKLDFRFSNSVLFTIQHLEIYRVVTACLYQSDFLGAIFGIITFNAIGPKLEASQGSTGLLYLVMMLNVVGNAAFLAIFGLLTVAGDKVAPTSASGGFWNVLVALIAIDCMAEPDAPRRFMMFPCQFPSKFFPVMLYGLLCLFGGGLRRDMGLFMLLGYAYGMGKLDRYLKAPRARLEGWESGCLSSMAQRPGYIVGGAGLGQDAWLPINSPEGRTPAGSGGGTRGASTIFSSQQQQPGQPPQGGGASGGGSGWVSSSGGAVNGPRGGPAGGAGTDKKSAAASTFAGSGQTLGGGGGLRRQAAPDADATRAARLAALERSSASSGAGNSTTGGLELVGRLQEMGYSAEQAREALTQSGGDLNGAVSYLAS